MTLAAGAGGYCNNRTLNQLNPQATQNSWDYRHPTCNRVHLVGNHYEQRTSMIEMTDYLARHKANTPSELTLPLHNITPCVNSKDYITSLTYIHCAIVTLHVQKHHTTSTTRYRIILGVFSDNCYLSVIYWCIWLFSACCLVCQG